MDVTARYSGGVAFQVSARGHRITCDQPKENHGADSGMTPPELLVASLATCAGYYAVQYLLTRGLPTNGVEVRVTANKALKPARLGDFRIEVNVPGVDEQHEAGILRAVKACLIHNTLLNTPAIETLVHTGVALQVV